MKRVVLVDDEQSILDALLRCLDEVDADLFSFNSPQKALDFCQDYEPHLIISDQRMPLMNGSEMLIQIKDKWPACQCILLSAYHDFDAVADAFNNQVIEKYICKPWDNDELTFIVEKAISETSKPETDILDNDKQAQKNGQAFHGMISSSPLMQSVFERIEKASTANVPIFITGETGTGKELVAKACHEESYRANEPFIPVNCANFSENLIESQLFGHKKGAFTGADSDSKGLFKVAGKGTLFLDEVTTLPLSLQAKLLRVIQEREFAPLGSHNLEPFHAQLITASSTSLLSAVKAGEFREDLFYRLNVLVINLPPLRERGHDIAQLAEHMCQRVALEQSKEINGFTPEAMVLLESYSWPGNIRQLENFIHSMVALSSETLISDTLCQQGLDQFSDLTPESSASVVTVPVEVAAVPTAEIASESVNAPKIKPLRDVERETIEQAIDHCDGNIPKAAALLEVSPSTIYRKMQAWESQVSDK
jgi:two-component system repressor protein LuxO